MNWEERLAEIKEGLSTTPLDEMIASIYPDFSDLPEVPERTMKAIARYKDPEDEERIPDAKTLLDKLGQQKVYKDFYAMQKDFEGLLAFDDQEKYQIDWPKNVESVQRKWIELQKYVKQYNLAGYFCAILEKLSAAREARKEADVAEVVKFSDTYSDRETALKKGLSEQDIKSRLEIFDKVRWLWGVSNKNPYKGK
jgi:hypothetical protein